MEFCPKMSCWTARTVLLVTFVVLLIHQDSQQNVASASPTPVIGFEDYSEGRVNANSIQFEKFDFAGLDDDRLNVEQPSLYELLLQRELLADKLDSEGRGHFVVRKSDRSPSLRRLFCFASITCKMLLAEKKGPVPVNETEIGELVNVSRLKEDLQKGFDQLKSDYMKHLSLRSASGSIENLQVNFEGETYTLQEIAQIGRKGSQLIVVNLSGFPTVMKDVLKAINDSGMGLNPQQDGTTIFIPVPKVTKEYRESLAKNAKILFQKFKDHCRDIQNKYIREVKKKEKEVSSDLAHSVQQQIHSMAELYVSEGEKVMIDKQNELLGKD
ncbi:ribosome-recycling factor, mitochondrial isoform X1 [Daphnia magna]|uniref:Ribosome-recycling factor, mitochondrial n=1 Tax=Daphnia magna TaxID=35525 RepID=A0A4Y7MEH0_9CRUS|nr:ribosome-recycling factor, mitochondrial isoform X1 [Daphnia magna]CAG4639533.1 EOG090X0DUK [Daphnia magna]SVE79758.1 EOG090X0DUK [Daphnia magna]SVE82733.1 EOG090X0DUK [Daphnia magna]SVE83322.1 EOG090X0DUK [Daphnia magna]